MRTRTTLAAAALLASLWLSWLTSFADIAARAQEKKPEKPAAEAPSDKDIADAYVYLLGRLLVLRQERLDFEKEGFEWNKIIHREPGGVAWANPNFDVAYSEAWVAIDENTPVVLEVPEIKGRYYTWQILNGWGETVLNISERTFPKQPFGKYALCLKGSNPKVPEGALRVDLPCKTSRVLARVELGANPKEAVRLQKLFTLTLTGEPKIDKRIKVPLFANDKLPGADAFDLATAVLEGERDINAGMDAVRAKVKAVAALAASGKEGRDRVDGVVRKQAIPAFLKHLREGGPSKNGWHRADPVGNYGTDFWQRGVVNLAGIWANNSSEALYFVADGFDGSAVYTQPFPKDALPKDKVKYFWSVVAVDAVKYQVIPNALKRYLLNKESALKYAEDGSLTLVFAAKKPEGVPEANWLPTPEGQKFNLTFRFYGASKDLTDGTYFPPPLVKAKRKEPMAARDSMLDSNQRIGEVIVGPRAGIKIEDYLPWRLTWRQTNG